MKKPRPFVLFKFWVPPEGRKSLFTPAPAHDGNELTTLTSISPEYDPPQPETSEATLLVRLLALPTDH
jgi:hypothetical protein